MYLPPRDPVWTTGVRLLFGLVLLLARLRTRPLPNMVSVVRDTTPAPTIVGRVVDIIVAPVAISLSYSLIRHIIHPPALLCQVLVNRMVTG